MLFSAPRRLCAPSSLLLGIIASLLFFDPHAYAQGPSGYGTPVYTGGTAVTGTPISKYRLNSGSDVWLYSYGLYGQTETGSAIGTVSCKGDLTATFTWPSGVGPTPPAVIIEQQAEVLWNGYTGVTGSAFNPLNQVSPGVGVDCVTTKYSGQSATASVPLPASLTVVLSGLTATERLRYRLIPAARASSEQATRRAFSLSHSILLVRPKTAAATTTYWSGRAARRASAAFPLAALCRTINGRSPGPRSKAGQPTTRTPPKLTGRGL